MVTMYNSQTGMAAIVFDLWVVHHPWKTDTRSQARPFAPMSISRSSIYCRRSGDTGRGARAEVMMR